MPTIIKNKIKSNNKKWDTNLFTKVRKYKPASSRATMTISWKRGYRGGVFDADTQPTKGELDLKLAQTASGGLPVIFTIPLQNGELENTYDYIADVLQNPQDHPDIIPDGIPDFTIGLINSVGDSKEDSFFIECSKAFYSGSPVREYKIHPVRLGAGTYIYEELTSYKVAFVVAGNSLYDSYKVVDFYPSVKSLRYPIIGCGIAITEKTSFSDVVTRLDPECIYDGLVDHDTDFAYIPIEIPTDEYNSHSGVQYIKVEKWTLNNSGGNAEDFLPSIDGTTADTHKTITLKFSMENGTKYLPAFQGYVLYTDLLDKYGLDNWDGIYKVVEFDNNSITYPDLGVVDATDHGNFESIEDFAEYIKNNWHDSSFRGIYQKMDELNTDVGIFYVNTSSGRYSGSPVFKIEKIYYATCGTMPSGVSIGYNAIRITSFGTTNHGFPLDPGYQIIFPYTGNNSPGEYQIIYPYPGPDESNKVIYPEIVGYNWSNDGGDSSLTGRDVTIEQVIDKLKDKRSEIAGLLEQNEAALVYVKYGSSHLDTEQRPEVYFKVEKTYSRSYLTTGYILRFSVMSPGFENTLEPSIAWVFEDGTVKIWKKEDDVTYPHLGTYYSDNGGEEDLDELKSTFETLTRTLFNKIPKNGTAIFDLSVSGMGTLIIKAENVIRQMGTSWERGMYYTIMGGTGGFDFDFENYMGLVWVEVGGGTGGNANAVIWKKNNKMIYPELNSISWNHYGNPDIQTLAIFLEDNFLTIEDGIDEGGVALLRIINFSGSSTLLCKVEKSWRWIGTTATLGGLYITPLDVDLLGDTPCVIFLNSGSIPVIWKKEETSQTDPITLAMNMAEHLSSPGSGSGVLAGTDEEVSQMFLSLKENPQTSIVITDGNIRITPMLQEFKDSGDTYYLDLIFITQSNDYKVVGDGGDLEFTQKNLYKCYMKIKYEVSTKNFTVDILNTIEIN